MNARISLSLVFIAPLLACDAPEAEHAAKMEPVAAVEVRQSQPAPVDDENELVQYVAQCEAVLGKIPQISCDPENPAPGTTVTRIPVFVEGQLLGFGEHEEDRELLEARAQSGDYTCDFPSIGGDFACSVGSTLVSYRNPENPNVQWVGLCRGAEGDRPGYDRFIGNGLIGANEKTGEMCFFFGGNPDPEKPYALPHLTSDAPSSESLSPWLPPRDMPGSCLSCHPNNDPWVLTPWLMPSYMERVLTRDDYPLSLPAGVELEDVFAASHVKQTEVKHKTLLPEPLPEGRTAWTEEEIFDEMGELVRRQYRAVGSSYVDNEAKGLVKVRTGIRPDSWSVNFRERLQLQSPETSCANGCHALGNDYWGKLAQDSIGNKASKYASPMMTTDSAPGFGWMPIYDMPLEQAADAYNGRGEETIPAITECPIPKQVDAEPTVSVTCNATGGQVEVQWTYLNDFGDVPGRDDVRFDVAIDEDDTYDLPFGVSTTSEFEGVMIETDEAATVIRDVAADQDGGSNYRMTVPFGAGQSTLSVDLQPKRFCFEEPDRRPFAYAPPHRIIVDLAAACG
jgi:hypothetical protein